MYKSDSNGFFSTTIVYRYSDTSSYTVSCIDLNYNGLRITWISGQRHVGRLVHGRNVWNFFVRKLWQDSLTMSVFFAS